MDREAAIILDKARGPQDQLAGREGGRVNATCFGSAGVSGTARAGCRFSRDLLSQW
ncbi:hypothetical protein Enr13x_64030 [Stieleria neptunia]|uniref:Uncharacterized protein n=1 Tax=Stieleria neptunia TaxID=2527979 RepID=A0A518I0G9_9BACT|nr:hypothetical protein Enr13x_64030 [Stieleria neptunia]